ncbi:MAG TPA: pilus assembly protein PilN [Gammaproteobacteria bacterium]|nr:pilus assembly protein PilN [Gammaproteobacteria bacterium]
MPHINLLPWREEERREKQRQFINIAAGAAIVMVGIIVLVHLRMSGVIEDQNNRNQFLEEVITQVDKEIAEIKTLEKEKAALLARMKIIQELQSSRPEIVHIFDEIARTIPDKAFLLKMSRKGREISLEGVADSNDYVSEFMRNLNNSPWLTNPRLTVIQSDKKEYPGASWFQLTVKQKNQTKKADK